MLEYNSLDLHWYLRLGITAFVLFIGLIYLVKNTASKYFIVDGDDDSRLYSHSHSHSQSQSFSSSSSSAPSVAVVSPSSSSMPGLVSMSDSCAACGSLAKKHCSRCKAVRYCSESCQKSHWFSGHKENCGELKSSRNASLQGRRNPTAVALVPGTGISTQIKKILFPYYKFLELFNWKNQGFPPCGLLNCGNSCFANVVLQCLIYTRPLTAYLLEKGHRRECRRNDWCFLCELQAHMERASQTKRAFSPINILSRLPNIGGNLGYGKQEDAHEFMRFVVDTMQSVCLDEYGGEKVVHPSSQETTLIQHIFGGRLQSQVICTKCNNISNQFENMMDLTVEIHGDAASLEECLDQFTAKEWLDGDNKYKCDGCNDYVLAWKRLNIQMAPNILTIALKRFQRGRFGKLNKRVTFPETLDLSPYMSEAADGDDKYKLYAVVVHVDMLNASYFGHYICYTKDFSGNWYRIDDCKVDAVELDEVLSQGAYMLLYSRVSARHSCLNPLEETSGKEEIQLQTPTTSPETTPIINPSIDPPSASEPVPVEEDTSMAKIRQIQKSPDSDCVMEEDTSDSKPGSSALVVNGDCGDNSIVPVEDTEPPSAACVIDNDNGTDMSTATPTTSITNNPNSVESHVSNGEETKVEKTESATENAVVKTIKLKPLFAPGFLGKRPRKIPTTKGDEKATAVSKTEKVNGDLNPCSRSPEIVDSDTEPCVVKNGGGNNVGEVEG